MSSKERNNFYIHIDTLTQCVTIIPVSTNRTVSFYQVLCKLVKGSRFNQIQATWLVGEVESIDPPLSGGEYITVDYLRKAHNEFQESDGDLDIVEQISEWAFTDLAPIMSERSASGQEARRAFVDIANLSGTYTNGDLYSHVLESESFGFDDGIGCAITKVTLVVSSGYGLKNLLGHLGDSVVEMGHFSEPLG